MPISSCARIVVFWHCAHTHGSAAATRCSGRRVAELWVPGMAASWYSETWFGIRDSQRTWRCVNGNGGVVGDGFEEEDEDDDDEGSCGEDFIVVDVVGDASRVGCGCVEQPRSSVQRIETMSSQTVHGRSNAALQEATATAFANWGFISTAAHRHDREPELEPTDNSFTTNALRSFMS